MTRKMRMWLWGLLAASIALPVSVWLLQGPPTHGRDAIEGRWALMTWVGDTGTIHASGQVLEIDPKAGEIRIFRGKKFDEAIYVTFLAREDFTGNDLRLLKDAELGPTDVDGLIRYKSGKVLSYSVVDSRREVHLVNLTQPEGSWGPTSGSRVERYRAKNMILRPASR